MKKHIIFLPLCLVFIAGCRKTTDSTRPTTSSGCQKLSNQTEEHTSIFDAAEDAFVLEESANPFTQTDTAIELVDAPLWEQDQKAEFETVYFDFDQYKIKPEQKAALERNVVKIKQAVAADNTYIVVEGHACKSAGTPRYNTMLSERRAQEVKKVLVKHGIPAEKIKTVGRGSEMCKVPTGTREQQAPNRRVEFYIVHEDK